jgi:hypothetical protein
MWSGSSRMTVWSCWSDAAYTRSSIRVGGGRRPAPHVGRWLAANLDSVEREVEICCDEVPGVPSPPVPRGYCAEVISHAQLAPRTNHGHHRTAWRQLPAVRPGAHHIMSRLA